MRIGICDDNEIYLNYLHQLTQHILSDHTQITCEVLLPSQLNALIADEHFPYDILITDIDLIEANSIDLVKKLHDHTPDCMVIFISNYLQYALDVYDVSHVYFVLKSEAERRLPKALERALSIVNERKNSLLTIRYNHQYHQIPLTDITYIDALGRYITIHTNQFDYRCIRPLKEVENDLNSSFGRCHKSFIINFNYISTLQQSNCTLTTGAVIPISHTYNKSLLSAYKEHIIKYI